MLHLIFAASLALGPAASLAEFDHGIFDDLAATARIAAPGWATSRGDLWLRVDLPHRIVTLYQNDVALIAYAMASAPPGPLQGAPGPNAVLGWLSDGDRGDLKGRISDGTRVVYGAPAAREDHDGDGVVNTLDVLLGAKKLVLNKASYVSNYRVLRYPGGDVPRSEGVCTDTLVRALRNAGWDLQREIHEDALRKPALYPLAGKAPDANIDHRRIRMMLPWFQQNFVKVPDGAPYLPGDIVLLDTFPNKAGPDHAGIVSDRLGPSGLPLVVNNWTDGYVEQEMDLLNWVPVTHRFRVPMATPTHTPPPPLRGQ